MATYLQAAALEVLQATDIEEKLRLTVLYAGQILTGKLKLLHPDSVKTLETPGRPTLPVLVAPRELKQRKLSTVEGRATLMHAVAHIEFNAINLAWDAAYRFKGLPESYYQDWASVAADEARHFQLLQARMRQVGYQYGDFPAHNGLWEMAQKSKDDLLRRMALVPRVLEARGLDVTPGMIDKLKQAGDLETVAVLRVILQEEVRHVEVGTRWFHYVCDERGLDRESTFLNLLREFAPGMVRPPLNDEARLAAGFSAAEIRQLCAVQQ